MAIVVGLLPNIFGILGTNDSSCGAVAAPLAQPVTVPMFQVQQVRRFPSVGLALTPFP